MRARWGDKGVVDLAGLIGYYSFVSVTLNVFEVPTPPREAVERDSEALIPSASSGSPPQWNAPPCEGTKGLNTPSSSSEPARWVPGSAAPYRRAKRPSTAPKALHPTMCLLGCWW